MGLFWQLTGKNDVSLQAEVDIDVATAQKLQQQGAQLIDVREPDEFRAGHAAGARNIPLYELRQRLGELPTGKTVLLICQSGSRSWSAQRQLQQLGVTDVRNVLGGTSAWQYARLPMQAG